MTHTGAWPELVGLDVDEAARIIRADLRVGLCGDGAVITAVMDGGRVAVWYDSTTRLVRSEPRIG